MLKKKPVVETTIEVEVECLAKYIHIHFWIYKYKKQYILAIIYKMIYNHSKDGDYMDNFQEYLDGALKKVSFSTKEYVKTETDYDVFEEIREQIVNAREEANITQKELAKLSGLTQSNISNIENGGNRPTIPTLKKIADALGKRLVVDLEDRR